MARRSDQPWADSFRLYVILGIVIVVMRVVFRVILGGGDETTGTVVLELPEVPLPGWVLGIRLFGPVTQEALLAGLYDGMRLATIVICVGAANSLANPKRLLRSVPAALHEVGTALVVAVTDAPAVRGQRPPGAPGAEPAGRRHCAGSGGCGATSCPCSRTPSSARCGWRPAWTPAATAAPRARRSASAGPPAR